MQPSLFALDEYVAAPAPDEWVYVVQATGPQVKIGTTVNIPRRVGEFRRRYGRVWLLLLVPGGRRLERDLHHRFKDYRRTGEWFELGPELMDWIMAERLVQEEQAA